jgi:hypothetical protein
VAKFSDIYRDATKQSRIDGRTRDGRRIKAQAQEAKLRLNEFQWRPLLPLPPGIYSVFGEPLTDADIARADFSEWFHVKRQRKGAVEFQCHEPVGDERVAAIFDTLGGS